MAWKIAVSGKGGVGKTTVAGILARLAARHGGKVTAIDADPDSNLASALGVPKELRDSIKPLSQMLDLIEERTGVRPGSSYGGIFKLNPRVDDLLDKYGAEGGDGVRLLILGSIKGAGSGCFCPENALLRRLMRHLVLREDEFLIIDMEAGIEHLGRGTAERVDVLIIVVEPGLRSVETAAKIKELAEELGVKRLATVLNKVVDEAQADFIEKELEKIGMPVLCALPYDESISRADFKGVSPFDVNADSAVIRKLDEFMKQLVASPASLK